MEYMDPMHAARLAALESALCAVLREAQQDTDPSERPDGITVTLDMDGLDIAYMVGDMPIGGEGL